MEVCDVCGIDEPSYRCKKTGDVVCKDCYNDMLPKEQKDFVKID
jgi:hypothetical protein